MINNFDTFYLKIGDDFTISFLFSFQGRESLLIVSKANVWLTGGTTSSDRTVYTEHVCFVNFDLMFYCNLGIHTSKMNR